MKPEPAPKQYFSGISSLIALLILCMTSIVFSCEKVEEDYAEVRLEFVEPSEGEFYNSVWSPGDSLVFTFSFELLSGSLKTAAFIDAELGRYSRNSDFSPQNSEESIHFTTFIPKKREEMFTVRWKIPENAPPTSDGNEYTIKLLTYQSKTGWEYIKFVSIKIEHNK